MKVASAYQLTVNIMSKESAIKEATEIANKDGITMVVTFNEYAEYETDQYGYYPAVAFPVVEKFEVIVETIKPST